MATVKGDVHDIGKNIVGVVLACNNYEVTDLGVMVPCEKILAAAREQQADLIGLSGLITPSLDEMVHVAREMQRAGFTVPLLIGGATTSAAHTAVKIAPEYAAGRGACARRLARRQRRQLPAQPREQAGVSRRGRRPAGAPARRNSPHSAPAGPLLPLAEARRRRTPVDWSAADIPRPEFLGPRVFAPVPLEEIVPFIDWGPFFSAWELHGRFPDLLSDPAVGPEATKLYRDAQELLDRIVAEKRFVAKAVIGFWPANAVGDDIEVYADESRSRVLGHVPLPAPAAREARRPVQSLARRLRRAEGLRPRSTTSAASPSRRVTASTRSPRNSAPATTTIPPSWPRRWATGSPRRSPS